MEAIRSLYNWTLGDSLLAQIIQVFLIAWISYAAMMGGKSLMDTIDVYTSSTVLLLPNLYNSTQVIRQDPNATNSMTLLPSINAPSGLEFSYSCYLFLDNKNFQGNAPGLRHIFHKGSPVYKPLMCPGVYIKNNENTLVVYMNESSSWNTHCEIPSFPIGKWVHLAIVVRNMDVDVYINGNVAHRISLQSVPKQNYGDVYVFKNESFNDGSYSNGAPPFTVLGGASGFISRLRYTGYALNYEQIDSLLRAGPSTKLDSTSNNMSPPPYLADAWWVTYTR
jgi:hypothetical protein